MNGSWNVMKGFNEENMVFECIWMVIMEIMESIWIMESLMNGLMETWL